MGIWAECSRVSMICIEPMESRWLLAATVPVDTIGYAKPGDQFAGIVADVAHDRVFVSRVTSSALIVIDTNTAEQVATIPLAGKPGAVAITPDGAFILVAEPAKHQVEVISTATLKSQRVLNVGVPLLQLAGAVGGKFYALATTDAAIAHPDDVDATYASRSVGQFDLATGRRDRVLDLANNVDQFVRTDTAGKRLYVGRSVGYDGTNNDAADVNVYDVSNAAAVKTLAPLMGPPGRIVDVFADATTGRLYTANAETNVLELRRADGTVSASWTSPFGTEYDNRQMTGIAGSPGMPFVFGLFTDWQQEENATVVAFDAATGAVRRTYHPAEQAAELVSAATPNGRLLYVAKHGGWVVDGDPDGWSLGLVGSSTLSLNPTHNVITGVVFNDLNGDGARQSGEDGWSEDDNDAFPMAATVTIFVDLNNNGRFDHGTSGFYEIGDEPAWMATDATPFRLTTPTASGTYVVRAQIGESYDGPDVRPYVGTTSLVRTITLGEGQSGEIRFGITPGVRVFGNVYADVDRNGTWGYLPGQYVDEPSVAGAQVYLDLNNDGKRGDEPLSDAVPGDNDDGSYFTDWTYNLVARAGPIVVRLLNPKGYALAPATPAAVELDGIPGGRHRVDFAVQPQLSLGGTLYRDSNGNGRRDAGEGPLAGARVWLDLNRNGKFNKGEPTAVSAADGRYVIAAKERGTAPFSVLIRDANARPLRTAVKHSARFGDWKQTLSLDVGAYSPATLSLTAFLDRDRNRKWSKGDRWLAGTIAYIDLDRDGKQDKNEPSAITDATGRVTFSDLPVGEYVVRLRVSSKLNATAGTSFTVTLADGQVHERTVGVRVG